MNLSVLSFPQCFNADRSAFFFTSSLLEDSDQSWGSRFQSSQEAWRNVFIARNTRKDSAGASWVTLLTWVDRILFEFWETSPFKIIEQAVWNSIRDVVTARIVSLGAMPCTSSLPGLRKTCSALLTEGLCHTSEERSFFFWTGKDTLVAFQSRPKDFKKQGLRNKQSVVPEVVVPSTLPYSLCPVAESFQKFRLRSLPALRVPRPSSTWTSQGLEVPLPNESQAPLIHFSTFHSAFKISRVSLPRLKIQQHQPPPLDRL